MKTRVPPIRRQILNSCVLSLLASLAFPCVMTAADEAVTGNLTVTGSVGIGTTSPSDPLTVVANAPDAITLSGSSATSVGLRLTNSASGGRSWSLFSSGGGWGDAGAFGLRDNTAGAVRFVIDQYGHVGIGVVSPYSALQVDSGAFTGDFPDIVVGGKHEGLVYAYGAIRANAFQQTGNYDGGISLQSYLYSGGAYTFTDALNLTALGNVGIGTTNPAAKLDVVGSAKVSGNLTVLGSFSTASLGSGTLTGGSTGLTLNAGGTNQNIVLTPSGYGNTLIGGNVGIGTSVPANKLDVSGDIHSSVSAGSNLVLSKTSGASLVFDNGAGVQTAMIESGSPANANRLEFWTNTSTNSGLVERMRIDNAGNVGIGTTSPAVKLLVNGTGGIDSMIQARRNDQLFGARIWVSGDNAGQLGLSNAAATADSVYLSGNGVSYLNGGNVGIGTTTPVTKLDIGGGANYFLDSSIVTPVQVVGNGGNSGSYGGAYFVTQSTDGGGGFLAMAKARSITTGNFSAVQAGDTLGNLAFLGADGTKLIRGASITSTAETNATSNLLSANLNFRVSQANSYVEAMRIMSDGKIGIGTTSPGSKLAIDGTGLGAPALTVSGGVLGAPTATVLTTYPAVSTNGTNYTRNLGFYSWALPIASGVSDDGYRVGLDIENFVTDSSFLGTLYSQYGLWARVGSYVGGNGTITNSYGIFIENLDGPATVTNKFGLYQSNSTARNYFAGNVGIGTSDPGTYKLAVNGTIRAKELVVDTGWADYVFEDDYRLTPLSEVEAHIKEQKHLPGVPSAAEVAAHGVSIGEMQSKLLSKVEELTLHLIEQEKRLSALERENRELRARQATP